MAIRAESVVSWKELTAELSPACFGVFVQVSLKSEQPIIYDSAASSLALAAYYPYWCWLVRPTWRPAVASGFVLSFSEVAKTMLGLSCYNYVAGDVVRLSLDSSTQHAVS
jgi:hypothetical protein